MQGNGKDLGRIFAPKSVAIVGASTAPSKLGYRLVDTLIKEGFDGAVYPINPKADEICGRPVFRSLAEVPGQVDVVAIVLPAEAVVQAFRECVDKGVAGVVIISSGFAETAVGVQAQKDLQRLSRESGVRVIGPNCEGFVNQNHHLMLTFSMMFSGGKVGPVSLVSQSGAYCGIVFDRISQNGVGFAKIVSSGNEADVTALELFEYFANDPDTGVIVSYLEEIRQGREFLERMKEISRKKPVVINKVGWTPVGQKAAASHTGALAGSDKVIDAALLQCGVVRARHMDELVDMSLALATVPTLMGNRIAAFSATGGLVVETSDLAVAEGFCFPSFEEKTQDLLKKVVPYYGTTNNPVDLTAAALADFSMFAKCIRAAGEDKNVDAVVMLLAGQRELDPAIEMVQAIGEADKPVLVCWTAGERAAEAIGYMRDHGVPVYSAPFRVVTALRGLRQRGMYLLGEDFIEQR